MIKEIVTDVQGTRVITATGAKIPLGNKQFDVGEECWTDGSFVFGSERTSQPVVCYMDTNGEKQNLFVWVGWDNSLVYKIYNANNLGYTTIPVTIDGFDFSSNDNGIAFCYNADGTKFGYLIRLSDQCGYAVRLLDAQGWHSFDNIILDNYPDNIDCWIEDGAIKSRMFFKGSAVKDFDLTTLTYTDTATSAYFKYYTNGTLTSTSTTSGATLSSILASMLTKADSIIGTNRITMSGKYVYTGAVVDVSDNDNTNNFYFVSTTEAIAIRDANANVHPNYNYTDEEINKRKANASITTNLLNWNNEKISAMAQSYSPIWIARHYYSPGATEAVAGNFYTWNDDEFGESGSIPIFFAFMVASLDVNNHLKIENGTQTKLDYSISYSGGDGSYTRPTDWVNTTDAEAYTVTMSGSSDSTYTTPQPAKYLMIHDGQSGQDDISNTDTNTVTLDDGYTVTDYNTVADANGWNVDMNKITDGDFIGFKVYPCLTELSDTKILIDNYIINKTDNSYKEFTIGNNCRMPLISATVDGLKRIITNANTVSIISHPQQGGFFIAKLGGGNVQYVRNSRIYTAKGNNCKFDVTVTDESGTAYVLADGESLVFAVKKKADDTTAVITKTISSLTSGTATIELSTTDTAIDGGFYVYGFAITGTDKKDSFVPVGDFIVMAGVV